jgi:hypothetical protein
MRKLRRLPWRIPKSHNNQAQAAAPAPVEQPPRAEPERIAAREKVETLPVAFAGGRYVYGMAPSVPRSTEIRRKGRQRTLTPLAGVTG